MKYNFPIVPKTKKAKDLLKKMEKFNELADYFKTKEVQDILLNETGTLPDEKYLINNYDEGYGNPSEINVYFHNGKVNISKSFKLIKTNGKIGKTNQYVKRIIPGEKKDYNKKVKFKKLDKNFKPGPSYKLIDLKEAQLIASNLDTVKYCTKLSELFKEEGLRLEIFFQYFIKKKEIYIDKFLLDYKSFIRIRVESGQFFTPSLLNSNPEYNKKIHNLFEDYKDKIKLRRIKEKFNEWTNKNGFSTFFDYNFPVNSAIMFNTVVFELCQKSSVCSKVCSTFQLNFFNIFNYPETEEEERKIQAEIIKEVEQEIPKNEYVNGTNF